MPTRAKHDASQGLIIGSFATLRLAHRQSRSVQVQRFISGAIRKLDRAALLCSTRGVCRRCGCTEDRACLTDLYEGCAWTDGTETLCTACVELS